MKTAKIKIAIVGRPNVGKSAIFNRIVGRRKSIVDDEEGVTRDRIYEDVEIFGTHVRVIDTGGIDPKSKLPFGDEVLKQARLAIEEADALIQVVDSKIGVTVLDEEVSTLLLKKGKPLALAVNKVDDPQKGDPLHQFYGLGIEKMVAVSANHGYQIAELVEAVLSDMPPIEGEEKQEGLRIALLGRPNVGKSTLANHLIGSKRCCVSAIAGTTRDAIDLPITWDGKDYLFVDTAGIRKKKSEKCTVEKFAAIRTEKVLERTEVAILLLDAKEGITAHDKRIAKEIEEQKKACILVFNKWDLVKGFRMEHCHKAVEQQIPFLSHCPILFISAQTGRNCEELFPLIEKAHENYHKRIPTGELNRFIEKVQRAYHPPLLKGKRLRIYYLTQVSSEPPRFTLFVNYPDLMVASYKRYLVNALRKEFAFTGTPLTFNLKGKKVKDETQRPASV